jgi:hypothetical protein
VPNRSWPISKRSIDQIDRSKRFSAKFSRTRGAQFANEPRLRYAIHCQAFGKSPGRRNKEMAAVVEAANSISNCWTAG